MGLAQLDRDELLVLQPPRPRVLEELDHTARLTFADVMPIVDNTAPDPVRLLEQSARFLDQRRAIAGITEAIELSNVGTLSEFTERAEEIIQLARRLTRIDPVAVLVRDPEFSRLALQGAKSEEIPETLPANALSNVVRAMSSLVEFCPINELTTLGNILREPKLGHRCRLSYDWLKAFVRRHAQLKDDSQHLIGRAYAEGRLSLSEVSQILSLPRSDAVVWLERLGYARDLEVIRLTDEQRSDCLAKIRRERTAREGRPVVSEELIARDVLATQRIEDVDARPWIEPHPTS